MSERLVMASRNSRSPQMVRRGANLGVWRFRADWQASYEHTTGVLHSTEKSLELGSILSLSSDNEMGRPF